MRVWRISKGAYITTALSGNGGLYGDGRWHHTGSLVVYTAQGVSLAALEYLVHVDPMLVPSDLRLLEVDVPDRLSVEHGNPAAVTPAWRVHPPPAETQTFGTKWLTERRSVILCVPSAIVPLENNYLINPAHPEAKDISIVVASPFAFDDRLLG